VPRAALRACGLAALLACLVAATSLGGARAATVIYRDLVLHATGGFQPQTLPRHGFAPIEFQGEVDLSTRSGSGRPLPLSEAVIDFDRDGRLDVAGLPSCAAERVAALGTAEARAACRGAIVGEGSLEAMVGDPPTPLRAPLTIFNGPPEAGHPSAVLHARLDAPAAQTFAIPVPIERIPGPFRYRVTLRIPPIAAGLGSLTRIQVAIGRRFRAGGVPRSYVSARCSDHILQTHGRFTFADGTVIDGSVEKFCRAR
jgi:hypothetical protein